MIETIKKYWGLIVGAFLTLAFLFIKRNNDKTREAQVDAANVGVKIEDAKWQVRTETVLAENSTLMKHLAELEKTEKEMHAATLTPNEVEDYWNKRGK